MKCNFLLAGLSLLCIICVPTFVYAGIGTPVPIDGGLSLLVAAGIGYGVKKVRDERKRKKEMSNEEK